jgi:serine/threonine protein kinase
MLEHDPRATRTGTLVGTPHYIAPERALGERADHRCDIYSLGIVAYEMFVGQLPFAADSPSRCC